MKNTFFCFSVIIRVRVTDILEKFLVLFFFFHFYYKSDSGQATMPAAALMEDFP